MKINCLFTKIIFLPRVDFLGIFTFKFSSLFILFFIFPFSILAALQRGFIFTLLRRFLFFIATSMCSNKLFFGVRKCAIFLLGVEMWWKMIFSHLREDFLGNMNSKEIAINCQKTINFLASFIMWKWPIDTKTDDQFNLLFMGELICECWFWCGVNGEPRLKKIHHELIKKDPRKASNYPPDYGVINPSYPLNKLTLLGHLRYRTVHTHIISPSQSINNILNPEASRPGV